MTTYRLALMVGLALAPVAGPALAQTPGGSVVVGLTSSLAHPDPYMITAQVDNNVSYHLFENLVNLDEANRPKLQLAAAVDIAADGRTYTFKLRQGVRFHNGKVMTSQDVIASFERYRRMSPGKGLLDNVERVSAPDPHSIVVELKAPQPLFLEALSTRRYQFAVLPAEDKDKGPGANSGIGTGPYRLLERVPDSHIKLTRFADYTADTASPGPDGYAGRRTAYIDTLTFRVVPEGAARIAGVQSGDLQIADNIPVLSAKRLASDARLLVIDVMPFSKMITILHASQAPTDSVLVRRAIQAAINQRDVMDVALEGFYRLEHSFLSHTSAYHPGDLNKALYSQGNVEKARALLREAGYKGEPIRIMTTSEYAFMQNGMLVVAEQLKAAGMTVVLDMVDWQTNVMHRSKGTGGWNITTTGVPSEGPQYFATLFQEFSHFKEDKAIEEGFARLASSPDLADRKRAWGAIESRVYEQAYILVNGDRGMKVAATKALKNVRPYYTLRFWDAWIAK